MNRKDTLKLARVELQEAEANLGNVLFSMTDGMFPPRKPLLRVITDVETVTRKLRRSFGFVPDGTQR